MEYQNALSKENCLSTLKIQEEFPELIKYIDEIPRKFQANNKKEVAK